MNEKKDQISKTVLDRNNTIRSKSAIKYSSVSQTANFCCLQFNTNLNLAPPNWLSNEAECYGLRHMCSNSFSSFQMANMFSDYIGDVDVVSDAENIKNLLKIPYSKKSVSLMVHRIENTLLIDEFNIHKHLMVQINDNWEWLRKFFEEHILESSNIKEKCINCKINTFDEIQQKSLYSKFLHYTIADSLNSNQTIKNSVINQPISSGPSLPEPRPDEVFPDDSKTHQLFNHYFLWNFEDLHMLLGTNLSIFRSGPSSTSFVNSRLRNMSKPLSVLTVIDYWLDNLICDIPEVVTCYHLNGFVKKYGFVKTENLPHLSCSQFSPQVIKNVAQNIITFLKSNATKSGHTYWLFKGKNDDEIKLYNLTSICSESSVKGCHESQNPFTVPVAMLLYRVARTLKYNASEKKTLSPISIQMLLNNCLKILNEIKYSRIVTSIHYILSDIYIPHKINPVSPEFTDLDNIEHSIYSNDNSSKSDVEKLTYFVNIQDLCLTRNHDQISQKLQNSPPEAIVKTLEERCYKALYHVGCGLNCLQYFSCNSKYKCEEPMEEVADVDGLSETKHRFCSYGTSLKVKMNKKFIIKGIKNKSRKRNKQSVTKNLDNSNIAEMMYYKSIAENMPSWHNPPDLNDKDTWIQHFRILFYEKACFSYATLAEHEYNCQNYGKALKHFCFVFESQMIINKNNVCYNIYGFLFSRIGDCYLKIALNWNKADQFENELETEEEYDLKVRNALDSECGCENCILEEYKLIPDPCKSKEDMLKAAEYCFLNSLDFETIEVNIDKLNQRLSLVYNEYMLIFGNRILSKLESYSHALLDGEVDLIPSEIQNFSDQIRNYTFLATDKYGKTNDQLSLALINWNCGNVHRNISYHININDISTGTFKSDQDYINIALESFKKSLTLLGNRNFDPSNWDNIYWDLSDTVFNIAIKYQNKVSILPDEIRVENEKEVINFLLKALKYCDIENDSSNKPIYQFRTAFIHKRLGYFYCNRLRCLEMNTAKFRSTLHQCTAHYNHAFEMFLLMNRSFDCLEVIIEMLILDLHLVESAACSKVKSIVSTIDTLKKCVPVLSALLKNDPNRDINEMIIDEHDFSNKKEELLIILEDKLQFILKVIIKQAMVKQSKLTDKLNVLKNIYGDLLRKKSDIDKCTHLLRIITQISELSL